MCLITFVGSIIASKYIRFSYHSVMSESLQTLKLAILKKFNQTEKSFEEDIQTVKKWTEKQLHFPKTEISELINKVIIIYF